MGKILLVCMWGQCFNPAMITALVPRSDGCELRLPIHTTYRIEENIINVPVDCLKATRSINKAVKEQGNE